MAEDGYHGVSPVKAFPPQNSYGTEPTPLSSLKVHPFVNFHLEIIK